MLPVAPPHAGQRLGRGRLRRRLRRPPRVDFASGVAGQTVAMRVGYLLDPDGQVSTLHGTQGTEPLASPTSCATGAQVFEAFTYLGFRYCRSTTPGNISAVGRWPPWPGTPPCRRCPWLPSRPGTACSTRCGASTPAPASTAARNSSSTRRRGEGPVHLGRVQRVRGRSCAATAIRTSAGRVCATCNGLRPATGPTAGPTPCTPTATARASSPRSARCYVEWVWRYYTGTGDQATTRWRCTPRRRRWRTGCGRPQHGAGQTGSSTGWVTPATATPSTATTSPWRPTRPATCWRSMHSTGWRSWRPSPATAAGGALSQSRAAQLTRRRQRDPAPIGRHLHRRRRRLGCAEWPRLPGGQRPRAGLRRGANVGHGQGREPTWPGSASRSSPTTGSSSCGPGRGRSTRPRGAHAHRRLHSGLGPRRGGRRHLHLGGLATK